jgi:hypothetical protein
MNFPGFFVSLARRFKVGWCVVVIGVIVCPHGSRCTPCRRWSWQDSICRPPPATRMPQRPRDEPHREGIELVRVRQRADDGKGRPGHA